MLLKVEIVIKKSEIDNYRVEYDMPDMVTAPISLNEEVGCVKVYYNDEVIFESPLYTIDNTKNIDIRYMIDGIIGKWF